MSKLTHHQESKWKISPKPKSKYKIPSNHFSIVIDYHKSNSNNNNNHNKSNYNENLDLEKRPAPEPVCCDNSPKHLHCTPRRGELIINGGFENRQDPFLGWVINSGVDEIDSNIGDIAHQGLNAARLGIPEPHAILYQDVPGICPGIFYNLNFFMSAATEYGHAPINVRMEFLDFCKDSLDRPALQILIPKDSLISEVFTGFNNTTHFPAPYDARFARISFETNTIEHRNRYVHLDDVSLTAIWNPEAQSIK